MRRKCLKSDLCKHIFLIYLLLNACALLLVGGGVSCDGNFGADILVDSDALLVWYVLVGGLAVLVVDRLASLLVLGLLPGLVDGGASLLVGRLALLVVDGLVDGLADGGVAGVTNGRHREQGQDQNLEDKVKVVETSNKQKLRKLVS